MTANSQQSKGLGEGWQCFPAGWDKTRVQSASKDDIQKLKKALIDMSNKVKQRLLRSAAELEDIDTKMNSRWPVPMSIPGTYIPPATPDFIKLIQRLWPTGPWGILVYRSIGYSDAVSWNKEIQHRLEDLITRPFACCSHFESGAKEAASRFRLIYVEYEDFEAHAANPSAANWISRQASRLDKKYTQSPLCFNVADKGGRDLDFGDDDVDAWAERGKKVLAQRAPERIK
ncbi:hypothetical protein B0O99DRAFT_590237 [Bisporella sp. PMI_857]|nr:hypothetical protein B0O99DRAFT_590646 [Bisporella sp. PMI_857]KAH8600586.1 hypothetical protein B0O99DRAFT_590237 [Bisporella sp. PMI_857]